MIDVRIDTLDGISIYDETKEELAKTFAFSLKEQGRMRSFAATLNYLLNWGRGDDGLSPTKIIIHPDFSAHSFVFTITTFRFDDDKMAIVPNTPFTILMYYRAEDDRWETHS